VVDLFDTVRCRKLAVELGFEKMLLKDEILKCYFVNKPDSPYFESAVFHNILSFIQTQTNKAKLRQVGKMFMLVINDVKSMQQIVELLDRMNNYVKSAAQPEMKFKV
jgi:transcription-repair coupling factor (superfamily II helicase)